MPQLNWTLILLSALAGAIHVLAPDHWVPASIVGWQRRWSTFRSALYATLMLSLHVLMGAGAYFLFDDQLRTVDSARLFNYSLGFVALLMALRAWRFSMIRDIQRVGPHLGWATTLVLTLLGPCESIIPIFLKSASLGVGYVVPFGAFLAGTLGAGITLTFVGREVWNRPFWLIRAFDRGSQRLAALPVAAGVVLGLRFLLRI